MKTLIYILITAGLSGLVACNHHRIHKAQFYNKLGEAKAGDEGYHSNEANRLLDYNEQNKEANQEHAEDAQKEVAKNLNQLNKPNTYNTKTGKKQKKKKKYNFHL